MGSAAHLWAHSPIAAGCKLRKTKTPLAAIGLVLTLSRLTAAQNGKVESTGPLTDAAVPEQVRQSLDLKGYRLMLDDPNLLARFGSGRAFRDKQRKTQRAYPIRNWLSQPW